MERSKRRILFLPVWLVVMLAIVAMGLYLGYKAPEIVAGVVIVSAVVGGAFSFLSAER